MEEPKKDLKSGEKETPAGNDPPDKKPAVDETVTIPKSELEKIKEDRDNYKQGLIKAKRAGRRFPGSEPDDKPKPKKPEEDDFGGEPDDKPPQEFVTKKELKERDEKELIAQACKDPLVDENWEEIIVYFVPPQEDSREAKEAALQKAIKLWKAEHPQSDKPDQGKKDTAELGQDAGSGKGKEKDAKPPEEKKHIIPKKASMDTWY